MNCRRTARAALLLSIALMLAGPAFAAPPSHTGLIHSSPGEFYPAPVVYAARDGRVYMVAPNGDLLRSWDSPLATSGIRHTQPLRNGNMLLSFNAPDTKTLVEIDLAGSIVWQYTGDATVRGFHHEHNRLPNGHTLIMCSRDLDIPAISDKTLIDDCLLELDPSGNIVWDWRTSDHFDEFGFSDDTKQRIFEHGGDWAHSNAAGFIYPNSLNDPRFAVGNVILSYRHLNMTAVVDRQSGDIVWLTDNLTIGQHNTQIIQEPLPGGSNFLIFDNGFTDPNLNRGSTVARNYSRVIEVNPLDQSIVWEYTASESGDPNWTFYSSFISSAQRLPNGNTFIDEGQVGRMFEVDPTGKIVWEYINPVYATFFGTETNLAYRAQKVWYWFFGNP